MIKDGRKRLEEQRHLSARLHTASPPLYKRPLSTEVFVSSSFSVVKIPRQTDLRSIHIKLETVNCKLSPETGDLSPKWSQCRWQSAFTDPFTVSVTSLHTSLHTQATCVSCQNRRPRLKKCPLRQTDQKNFFFSLSQKG